MLRCGEQGYRLFQCPGCGEFELVYFGCNSRVCTHCGKKMEFVLFGRGKPPPKWNFGERIVDWNYISTSVCYQ